MIGLSATRTEAGSSQIRKSPPVAELVTRIVQRAAPMVSGEKNACYGRGSGSKILDSKSNTLQFRFSTNGPNVSASSLVVMITC